MARRKFAFVLILIGMMALILSPWSNSPRREAAPATLVTTQQPESPIDLPTVLTEPASLSVAVAMDETAFKQLADQNISFRERHPDITVTLTRIAPEDAYRYFKRASAMEEAADIMLLRSEWVNEFAASGYLLPADNAFTGKTLAEQFDAIIASVKWNEYLWGVPLDIDPYVLVWNKALLRERLGDDARLPLTGDQWREIASGSTSDREVTAAGETANLADAQTSTNMKPASWLSLNPRDPYTLLAWLENVTGERTDELWSGEGEHWEDSPLGEALRMLDTGRSDVNFSSLEAAEVKLLAGETLALALPHSYAVRLLKQPGAETILEIDYSTWKLPYVWPRGNSYVISAATVAEEAAYTWIQEMTSAAVQSSNEQVLGRLPVYRSLYGSNMMLSKLISPGTGQTFPNQSSSAAGPMLPSRLKQLSNLWESYALEQLSLEEWKLGWTASLAELQDDD